MDAPKEDLIRCVVEFWAEHGRLTELPAEGFCMWPSIRSGDRVTVRHGGASPLVGQVVVRILEGRATAHRVIDRRQVGDTVEVRTKGDLTLAADPGWIGPDRTVGVVVAITRQGVALGRPQLEGRAARVLAAVSRVQGAVCAPLHRLRVLFGSRRAGLDRAKGAG
jgi:hypothetical protein